MSSIKPPSGPSTTLPHTVGELQGAAPGAPLEGPNATVGPSGTSPPSSDVGAVDAIAEGKRVDLVELARAVETGQLSMAQAVDQLVEGTVG